MEREKFRRELLHSLRYAPDRQAAAEFAFRRLDQLVAAAQKIAVTRQTGELPTVEDDHQALDLSRAVTLLVLELEKEAGHNQGKIDEKLGSEERPSR